MLKTLHTLALVTALSLPFTGVRAQSGTLDTSFGTNGKVTTAFTNATSYAEAVAIQPDGKIIVAGYCNNGSNKYAVVRYNANGTIDTTFGTNGFVRTEFSTAVTITIAPKAIALQPDGKILVAGTHVINYEGVQKAFLVMRYNANGTLDTTFGFENNGISAPNPGECRSIALTPEGKIVLGGQFPEPSAVMMAAVLEPNGMPDMSFNMGGVYGYAGYNIGPSTMQVYSKSYCNKILVQPDGKIILAGYYTFAPTGNKKRIGIVRVDPATTYFDGDFAGGLVYGYEDWGFISGYNDHIHTAALQSDGKIVIAGYTEETNGGIRKLLMMRVNGNGTADTTFGTNGIATYAVSGGSAEAKAIHIQADGRIVLAGNATGNGDDFMVARFLPNGMIDPSYGTNGVTKTHFSGNDIGNAIAVQSDNKVVVAGAAIENTQPQFAVARYHGGTTMGTNEVIADNALKAYPNPVKDILTIKSNDVDYNTSFSLYNLMGQKVYSGTHIEATVSVDMSAMASGIYMLASGGKEAIRVVKQ